MKDFRIKNKFVKLCWDFKASLDSDVCRLLFKLPFDQKTSLSVCFKTRGRAIQTLSRTVQALRENWKLRQEFEKPDQVLEKLSRVFKRLRHVSVL